MRLLRSFISYSLSSFLACMFWRYEKTGIFTRRDHDTDFFLCSGRTAFHSFLVFGVFDFAFALDGHLDCDWWYIMILWDGISTSAQTKRVSSAYTFDFAYLLSIV